MPRLYRDLNMQLYTEAVADWASGKWARGDVLTFIEEWVGIDRAVFRMETMGGDSALKIEAVDTIAGTLGDIVEDIMEGRDLGDLIGPVTIDARIDGLSGKTREIATLDIWHQLLGHVAKASLDPLFSARLLPTQHASIPGRGQTGLKRQAHRYLRRQLGIRYLCKTDVCSAYKTLTYDRVIALIEEEIPRAKETLKLLRYLATLAPGGHLIIGGYLDAWLFNLAMSYAIRYAYTLGQNRRGIFTPYVVRIEAYMDDFGILGRTASGLRKARKKLQRWFEVSLGLKLRFTTGIIRLDDAETEKGKRREKKKPARACPGLDMGGYLIHRTYITMRPRVFLRARRQWLRAWRELEATGTMPLFRALKVISYNGNLMQSDSYRARHIYHTRELLRVAKHVVGYHARQDARGRKEKIYAAYRRYEHGKAELCSG